jgi:C-terminal processing protease CtpA/Prc
MRCILVRFRWLAAVLLLATAAARAEVLAVDDALDASARAHIVTQYARQLIEGYAIPAKGKQAADDIRNRLARGEYDNQTSARSFAGRLSKDVEAVCRDKHTRLEYVPYDLQEERPPVSLAPAQAADNYGLQKFDQLPGNIGYLRIGRFAPVDAASTEAAARFMSQAANSSALIIDVRGADGDSPEMVALLSSYVATSYNIFNSRIHLYDRVDNQGRAVKELWTNPKVPGQRYGNKSPLYLLVDGQTRASGEAFAYNLQQLKRATIVGKPTAGDAHIKSSQPISRHLIANIASLRDVNVISHDNWEGGGVQPDQVVASAEALEAARAMAGAALNDSGRRPSK